ncbi:Ig-like domain-containing protein [Lachnospiraceae bacterium 29-84]
MKQSLKRYLAMLLTFAMVFTMIPTSFAIAAEGEEGTTQTIAASKFVASGGQGGIPEKTYLIAVTGELSSEGNDQGAAYVSGETASSGKTVLGSTRVAAMGFELTDAVKNMDPNTISNATVTIYVDSVDRNMSNPDEFWTKAGLFAVDASKYEGLSNEPATFPAKDNNYSYDATVFCAEQIINREGGLGAKTFDVTDWVKAAIQSGDSYAVFRLQTVIAGFRVVNADENAPKLTVTTSAPVVKTDQELADQAAAALSLPTNVRSDLDLPTAGLNETVISWASSNTAVIANNGTVTLPQEDTVVKLTATVTKGEATATREFNVTVRAKSEGLRAAYAFKADALTSKTIADESGNGFDATLQGSGAAIADGVLTLPGGASNSSAAYVSIPKEVFVGQDTLTITTWLKNATGADNYAAMFFGATANPPADYWLLNPAAPGGFFKSVWTTGDRNTSAPWGTETPTSKTVTSSDWAMYTTVITPDEIVGYYNGTEVSRANKTRTTTDFGENIVAYIGRSSYPDIFYKGGVYGVAVYDTAFTQEDVWNEYYGSTPPTVTRQELFDAVADGIFEEMMGENESAELVHKDLSFTASKTGIDLAWNSSDTEVIDGTGKVLYSGAEPKEVTITVTGTYKGQEAFEKSYVLQVMSVDGAEYQALGIPNSDDIRGNITLPTKGKYGSDITWTSSNPDVISTEVVENAGYDSTPAGVVNRQDTDTEVTLTATLKQKGGDVTKPIKVTVKAKAQTEEMTDYIFAYFIGDGAGQEKIFFASSQDGLNWEELNHGNPVFESELGEKGLRDPFIIRSPEGDKFYMIATDLCIGAGKGWNAAQTAGSQAIMVWESNDLVNWSDQRMVTVSAGIEAGCTWAPEAYYDKKTGEYLVFWASKIKDDNYSKQRVYYSKTRDFYTFTDPQVWIDESHSTIDSTVIESGGKYYRYSKYEGQNYVYVESADTLLGEWSNIGWDEEKDREQAIANGVEGPCCFKFNDDDIENAGAKFCLLVDNYGAGGYYPMGSDDLSTGTFTRIENAKLPSRPRHGTVMPITRAEYQAIMAKYGTPSLAEGSIPDRVKTGYTLPTEVVIVFAGEERTVSVTWDRTAEDFQESGTVRVTGTITGTGTDLDGKTVTKDIEVVSGDFIYYIDSGVGSWNPKRSESGAYKEIAEEFELRNAVPDQYYKPGSWGVVNDNDEVAGNFQQEEDSIYANGWWARSGKKNEYIIPLEAGSYKATGFYTEWWGVTRAMKFYAEYTDDNGQKKTSEVKELTLSKSATRQTASISFTIEGVAGTTEVHFITDKTASDDPVISGLSIEKNFTDEEKEQLETARTEAKKEFEKVTVTATSEMFVRGTDQINVTCPDGFEAKLAAANYGFTKSYSSSDESVATVDMDGKITGVKAGEATITTTLSLSSREKRELTTKVTVKEQAVTGITLDQSAATVKVGARLALKATVTPEDATDKSVKWTTSDDAIATVSSSGSVYGKKAGKVTITATAANGMKATCEVTVENVEVTGITLSQTTAAMEIGEAITLRATVAPSNATNKTVVWTSSNEKVATVANGTVIAVARGKATITAASADGKVKATCEVTVGGGEIAVTGISLSKSTLTLETGKSATLTATVAPADATNKTVTWKSSNTSIATVVNGKVTAGKKTGTATITATAGAKSATCKVTVKAARVAVKSVKLNKTKLTLGKGEKFTLKATVSPKNATNKKVTWKVSKSKAISFKNGKITAKAKGSATITATVDGKKATCKVTVKPAPKKITLNKKSKTLRKGKTFQIKTKLTKGSASNTITYKSSNKKVATVSSSGKVKAVKKGTARITVKTFNNKKATVKITVK